MPYLAHQAWGSPVTLPFWLGMWVYIKCEHTLLSIKFNTLFGDFRRKKRIVHLLFSVGVTLAVSLLVDSIWFVQFRNQCEREAYCDTRCHRGELTCAPLPVPDDGDFRGRQEWWLLTVTNSSIYYDRCGPSAVVTSNPTDTSNPCAPCAAFPFASKEALTLRCASANTVCPRPPEIVCKSYLITIARAQFIWVLATPITLLVKSFLRCLNHGLCAGGIAFIILCAVFSALIVVLFIISSVIKQFLAILYLFLTSYALSLLLELPQLLLVYGCLGGKGRLEKRIEKVKMEVIGDTIADSLEESTLPRLMKKH